MLLLSQRALGLKARASKCIVAGSQSCRRPVLLTCSAIFSICSWHSIETIAAIETLTEQLALNMCVCISCYASHA